MKNRFKIILAGLFLLCAIAVIAQTTGAGHSALIIIDGKPATEQELEALQQKKLFEIQFLNPSKAQALYGPAGANGALLVTTLGSAASEEPLVLLNGRPIPADSLQKVQFEKIDVIRGQQALNLYGPAGKDGVYLVQAAPELTDVWLEIRNKKGKPVKGAQLTDEQGNVLAVSNSCGIITLENFSKGTNVIVKSKKYKPQTVSISSKKQNIILLK